MKRVTFEFFTKNLCQSRLHIDINIYFMGMVCCFDVIKNISEAPKIFDFLFQQFTIKPNGIIYIAHLIAVNLEVTCM